MHQSREVTFYSWSIGQWRPHYNSLHARTSRNGRKRRLRLALADTVGVFRGRRVRGAKRPLERSFAIYLDRADINESTNTCSHGLLCQMTRSLHVDPPV